MQHRLADRDLAGVRSPEGLARLPEAERQVWKQFWNDVQLLLEAAKEPVPSGPQPKG
jgi:hypothetical protein